MFLAPRQRKGLEPLLAKITVFTVFCGKHTGIYSVSSMLSQAFFGCQRHNDTVNYTIFTRGQHLKNPPKIDQKTPNKDLQNASSNFTLFFPTPNPQKRENPSTLKDFQKGRRQGRAPG